MKMQLKDGILYVAEINSTQFEVFRSWNLMKWNKQRMWLEGPATLELLNKISSIAILPPAIEAERVRLRARQAAVDAMRLENDPKPLIDPPVKANLFKHQVRGYNMALLVFGLVDPSQKKGE